MPGLLDDKVKARELSPLSVKDEASALSSDAELIKLLVDNEEERELPVDVIRLLDIEVDKRKLLVVEVDDEAIVTGGGSVKEVGAGKLSKYEVDVIESSVINSETKKLSYGSVSVSSKLVVYTKVDPSI
jgi:hypothetical protein